MSYGHAGAILARWADAEHWARRAAGGDGVFWPGPAPEPDGDGDGEDRALRAGPKGPRPERTSVPPTERGTT